jgi:ribosomal protein S18 acetylase RimI-like enzyme
MSSDFRAPTLDDLPALTEFFAAIRDEYGGRGQTESQLRDYLTSRHANVPENFRVALEEGRVTGWIAIWHPESTLGRIYFHVEAHPREHPMYARLLDWGELRARGIASGDRTRLQATVEGDNDVFAAEVRARGYELVRHFFDMEIDLADEPAEPSWPDGIRVRTFEPGDERAIYEGDLEAFQDHWDSVDISFDEWREHLLESSDFELAGFSLCTGERRPQTGYVNVLAVRRPWRMRGLGTALLLHSFRELRRRGRSKADLNVDGDNITGALRLYERAGMHVVRRYDHYWKEPA